MANHPSSGRDVAHLEADPPSWRPEDQQPRGRDAGDRDDRGWQDRGYRDEDRHGERELRRGAMRGGHRDERALRERETERYGQGQSGYAAGRYGDERLPELQGRSGRPTAGSFEDRDGLGLDDRFTGRGYWQDRVGYVDRDARSYRGRDFEPERSSLSRSGRPDERLGYSAGSYGRGYGGSAEEIAGRDLGSAPHVHRGTGPHRGKGPVGYRRSDERIREAVCESLADDDELDASHIEVAVSHGEVTLSGTVDDRRAKREAEDCAYSVSGVRDVQNHLRVVDRSTRSNPSGSPAVGNSETETAQDKKHRA